ncbi:MAG: glutamate 5-kinase [Candidatus Pelagibacter sp.]|nr:glutamate 5-kinase [Candidatus Pelagibacter sp.]OUV86678.1 MAG: glutamate 5-kinase [Pelagibacteraceae bacterium TMED136]|tara:strand:- start:6650 stop:7753 length:1104 start_codon:yes stop_codon:yes gene_type:complete
MFLKSKRIVIKIGSSLLIKNNKINNNWVSNLSKDIFNLSKRKIDITIVTSGAIALGCKYLKISRKNLKLKEYQAVSSIGQIELINLFKKALARKRIKIGQILLTLEDTENRRRALNAKDTIENIFKLKGIPIVNENDTTATNEIRYGDNDRLAARVAQILSADTLIMLSDIDGLYTKDPKKFKNAEHIKKVKKITTQIIKSATKSVTDYGSGGMITKIDAAKICMDAGCRMILTKGSVNNPISKLEKDKFCTIFIPNTNEYNAKKKWILSSLNNKGSIIIDDGANEAIIKGKSLLPVGIYDVKGKFNRGETVSILDKLNNKIGTGVVSYSSDEIFKIKGIKSSNIKDKLGYISRGEVIHIDNMVFNK